MSYVNFKKMLKDAYKGGYAVGHFNINSLTWAKTILEVCEEMNSPVILGVSEGAIKFIGGYNVVVNMVKSLIVDMKLSIPVSLHLDHGQNYDSCEKAIVAGFSSVMIDKSHFPIEENIKETKKVYELAKKYDVSIEAEVGTIGGEEDGTVGEFMYARVEDCKKIIESIPLDCFAPALGSVHGHYKGKPKLNFTIMKQLSEMFGVPLVLHGGSGILDYQIKKAISNGIAKINVNTEFQESFCNGIKSYFQNNLDKNLKGYDPRKIIGYANLEMKKAIKAKIILFGSNNKAR